MENYKVAWKHFEEICTLVIKLFEIAKEDKKVVVIVSDALRYEAANKLLSEMHGDAKNTAEISYWLLYLIICNHNFTSEAPGKRMLSVELTLSADAVTETFLKLKIFDVDDLLKLLLRKRFKTIN